MKIRIITSCTGEKIVDDERALTIEDFRQGQEHVQKREQELEALLTPAETLYSGQQHVRLMRGVEEWKKGIDLGILSAGYGLVKGQEKLAPYEVTFNGMKKKELREWADQLDVPTQFRKAMKAKYDLGLLLLGDAYIEACALDEQVQLGGPTLLFCGGSMAKKLPAIDQLRVVTLSNKEAKRFSCGLVGLKGELAHRLLVGLKKKEIAIDQLMDEGIDLLDLLEAREPTPLKKAKRPSARATDVDWVVKVPKSWWNKPHRKKLMYFIPEWDDLVDPDYDFVTDTHSGGTGDWSNEVYAHQMYPEPNYDGLLISKVVAEKSAKKKERINELGVHRFLRVPQEFPIMGDCGAFGYIKEENPPYETEEILDYYTRLQFNYGVSIDHLIGNAAQEDKQHRYDLTIHNADEFLREHKKRELEWEPIGAVQGWDPKSYAAAAKKLVAMGYTYIALGGLVRMPSDHILAMLEEVKQVVPKEVKIHLFGLARIKVMDEFAKMGVTSVDSASLLRRAWMGTGQNYLTMEGAFYTAIRIPEAGKSFRAKRMVSEGRATAEQVVQLEQASLKALRDFDRGKRSVKETLEIVDAYDRFITPDRPDNSELLRHTLEARPWKSCPCDICKKDGVEVVIFRGNNRNRRRGFHNTYAFYRLAQWALDGEKIAFFNARSASPQLSLFEEEEDD